MKTAIIIIYIILALAASTALAALAIYTLNLKNKNDHLNKAYKDSIKDFTALCKMYAEVNLENKRLKQLNAQIVSKASSKPAIERKNTNYHYILTQLNKTKETLKMKNQNKQINQDSNVSKNSAVASSAEDSNTQDINQDSNRNEVLVFTRSYMTSTGWDKYKSKKLVYRLNIVILLLENNENLAKNLAFWNFGKKKRFEPCGSLSAEFLLAVGYETNAIYNHSKSDFEALIKQNKEYLREMHTSEGGALHD